MPTPRADGTLALVKSWRPLPLADLQGVNLTAEEGFVLSRVGEADSIDALADTTGLGPERVRAILQKLASVGAVVAAQETTGSEAFGEIDFDVPAAAAPPVPAEASPPDDAAPLEAATQSDVDEEGDDSSEDQAEAGAANAAEVLASHRARYESRFRAETSDARVAAASSAHDPDLAALCLDPDPRVIAAVLDNPRAGLPHARLVAAHHRTTTGLEFVLRRAEFARDTQVTRMLLRNDQLSDGLLRRLLGSRRLAEIYKVALSRDVPERTRFGSRALLGSRFAQSQADERVELVVRTEGRCLSLLIGQTFDSRTTSLLCRRPYHSVLFIQNLARFSACPPLLLVHLVKQPLVKRQPQLKRMLQQHPNMPSEYRK